MIGCSTNTIVRNPSNELVSGYDSYSNTEQKDEASVSSFLNSLPGSSCKKISAKRIRSIIVDMEKIFSKNNVSCVQSLESSNYKFVFNRSSYHVATKKFFLDISEPRSDEQECGRQLATHLGIDTIFRYHKPNVVGVTVRAANEAFGEKSSAVNVNQCTSKNAEKVTNSLRKNAKEILSLFH